MNYIKISYIKNSSINNNGGSLNPRLWFEWGPTLAYGSTSQVRLMIPLSITTFTTNLPVKPLTGFFQPNAVGTFGTSGKNILRGPRSFNTDLGILKNTRVTERLSVQFRAEFFNFFNTPHFNNPGANVNNLLLNPDGTVRNLNGFSEILSASGERQFRLGVRMSW